MTLPAGYRLRAPAPGDLDAVADVLIADELDEAGQIVLGVDFLRDEWSRVGFDLATDAWVVTDGAGTIAGYVQAMMEVVKPDQLSLVRQGTNPPWSSAGGSSTPGTGIRASAPRS